MVTVLHQQPRLHDVLSPLSAARTSCRVDVHSAPDDSHVQVHRQRVTAAYLIPNHARTFHKYPVLCGAR